MEKRFYAVKIIIMKRIKIIGIWLLIIMPYASKPSEFIYLLQNVLPGQMYLKV